ncbi:MAG: DUF4331 domain-containing protein, partial [Pseudomonadota bacterium]|nr:DUF4331 domain-containing protein [Pseudomonadota bacterium]
MKSNSMPRTCRLPVAAAVAACCALGAMSAQASSHREAPFISMNPSVDATDLYMFRSYEGVAADGSGGRSGYVTLLANYIPFQDPQGGPNFYMFNPNALYEIHIDNTGDGVENLTFQFRFTNTSKSQALAIGGKQVKIPLINSNTLDGSVNPAALNVREQFTVSLVRGARRSSAGTPLTNVSPAAGASATTFDKPVDNIGDKTFGSAGAYATYAAKHIYNVNIPGCTVAGVQATGKVFVGQRKEPFYIAVGKIFDLFNLNPLGPENAGNNNDLEAKNVSTLALEVPIACLTNGTEPVIGAFTTASLRQGRLIDGSPKTGLNKATKEGGAWTQVSRLGMPLVNEVVIGIEDKDRFNASRPKDDAANFADYVTNPVLPALVQTLFPSAPAPTNFPRTDLIAAFLTGIAGVNQPAALASTNTTRVLSEMLRLNTTTAAKPVASQNALGVAGGDTAGFPNGRR